MRLIFAVLVMLFVNVGLFMIQTTTDYIATTEDLGNFPRIYNYESSYVRNFDAGNNTIKGYANNASGILPSSGSPTASAGTTIITDIGSSIIGWIGSATGLNYLWGIVDAVPSFLMQIGLPGPFSYILGVLWHVLTITLIVIFIRGGGY